MSFARLIPTSDSLKDDIEYELRTFAVKDWETRHVNAWIKRVNKFGIFDEKEFGEIIKWFDTKKMTGRDLLKLRSAETKKALSEAGEFTFKKFAVSLKTLKERDFQPNWPFMFSKFLKFQNYRSCVSNMSATSMYEMSENLTDRQKFYDQYFSFFPTFFKYVKLKEKIPDQEKEPEKHKEYMSKLEKMKVYINDKYRKWTGREFFKENVTEDFCRDLEIDVKKKENEGVTELRFPFKVVITDPAQKDSEISFRKFISPLISVVPSKKKQSMKFGMFHLGFIVGPWYVEWNNSEIIIPRKFFGSKKALITADISHKFRPTVKDVAVVSNKLCDVCYLWNSKFTYSSTRDEKEKSGNCQDFYDDICKALSVDENGIRTGFLGPVITKLRKKGKFKLNYKPCKEVREKCDYKWKKKTFQTHKELDEMVIEIQGKVTGFAEKDGYKLLKAYDRALWLKHFRFPEDKVFMPLGIDEDSADIDWDSFDEEDEDEVDEFLDTTYSSRKLLCPFGDPRTTGSYQVDGSTFV